MEKFILESKLISESEWEEYQELKKEKEKIRLEQTEKVFDEIAGLIMENETCSYRFLIYDLLGFDGSAYGTLLSGLVITNMLVDYQSLKEKYNKALEILVEHNLPCELDEFNIVNAEYCMVNCSVDNEIFKKCWDEYIEWKCKNGGEIE